MDWKSNQETFLRTEFPGLLQRHSHPPFPTPRWGKLSFQGMIEHMSESIGMGFGKYSYPLQVDEQTMNKLRSFMLGEKVFRPGTPNSLIGENPPPLRFPSVTNALDELQKHIQEFFEYHGLHPGIVLTNPFFGPLNYREWLHLLCKHAWHHLNQFTLVTDKQYEAYLRNPTHS